MEWGAGWLRRAIFIRAITVFSTLLLKVLVIFKCTLQVDTCEPLFKKLKRWNMLENGKTTVSGAELKWVKLFSLPRGELMLRKYHQNSLVSWTWNVKQGGREKTVPAKCKKRRLMLQLWHPPLYTLQWAALALMNNSGHWEEAIRHWPNTSLAPSISVSEGSPGTSSILLKEPTKDTFDLQAKVALKYENQSQHKLAREFY